MMTIFHLRKGTHATCCFLHPVNGMWRNFTLLAVVFQTMSYGMNCILVFITECSALVSKMFINGGGIDWICAFSWTSLYKKACNCYWVKPVFVEPIGKSSCDFFCIDCLLVFTCLWLIYIKCVHNSLHGSQKCLYDNIYSVVFSLALMFFKLINWSY